MVSLDHMKEKQTSIKNPPNIWHQETSSDQANNVKAQKEKLKQTPTISEQ